MRARIISSDTYQNFLKNSSAFQKRRIWYDTLIFARVFRPLPQLMNASSILLSWDVGYAGLVIREDCLIGIGVVQDTIYRTKRLAHYLFATKPFKDIPLKYQHKNFLINLQLLKNLTKYYYEKELGITFIDHSD